jgi:hypothetical protein
VPQGSSFSCQAIAIRNCVAPIHAFGNDRCLVKATRIPVARATANNRLIRVTISLPDLI